MESVAATLIKAKDLFLVGHCLESQSLEKPIDPFIISSPDTKWEKIPLEVWRHLILVLQPQVRTLIVVSGKQKLWNRPIPAKRGVEGPGGWTKCWNVLISPWPLCNPIYLKCWHLQRQQMLGNCSATLEVLTVIVTSRIFAILIIKRTRWNLLSYGMETHFVYSVVGWLIIYITIPLVRI